MTTRTLLVFSGMILLAAFCAAEEPPTAETCAVCHESEVAAFATGPHGAAMGADSNGTLARSCVACHGPADRHVDDPSAENIERRPSPDACLSCHSGMGGLMSSTAAAHIRHSVACLDCHDSGHSDEIEGLPLKEPSSTLCAACHHTEVGAFTMPFAHRDGTRPFECTACHSNHSSGRTGCLGRTGIDGVCLDCHAEKTGPYVYPHPPRAVDGCTGCHAPHGSPNPRLLNRHSVMMLCLECHADIPTSHDLTLARYRVCTDCHTAVHGSNRDPLLFEE